MKVLLDQGTPAPLRKFLSGHEVLTVFELGWSLLKNGELLRQAEAADIQILITTDQNLKYQQNLDGRRIAIVVLTTTSWPRIEKAAGAVVDAVASIAAGSYKEIAIP